MTDYSKILEEAEKAVQSVKDQKFREVAFEKLLTHLLSGQPSQSREPLPDDTKPKKKKSKKTNDLKNTTSKTKSSKITEAIAIDKDLNLRQKGKKSFVDFYSEKKPSTAFDFNTVAVYYLSNLIDLKNITANQIYTCYKEVKKRPPEAFMQSLKDTARIKGFLDASNSKNIKLSTRGVNFVDHDLPPKKQNGK